MREWFGRAEIAAAACGALPANQGALSRHIEQAGWQDDPRRCRPKGGRGGGFEYHVSLLPADVQARLMAGEALTAADDQSPAEARSAELWRRFEALPETAKAKARTRLAAVQRIETLSAGGMTRQLAVALVAKETAASASTLWNWLRMADGGRRPTGWRRWRRATPDAPRRSPATRRPGLSWSPTISAPNVRISKPAIAAWSRRRRSMAGRRSPRPRPSSAVSTRTFRAARRCLPATAATRWRSASPHQTRDRSVFSAMEAVNADGHRFDVFVRFDDGEIGRPVLTAFQDVYSGMIVAHRLDRSENWTTVRLALRRHDRELRHSRRRLFRQRPRLRLEMADRRHAQPLPLQGPRRRARRHPHPARRRRCIGRRPITARPSRSSGPSATSARRSPSIRRCAGAYIGNRPDAKPENYGSKAIAFDDFRAWWRGQIARHNGRRGRRSATARGRSFAETFRDSIEAPTTLIRRATSRTAADVPARRPRGCRRASRPAKSELGGNRYWTEALADHVGRDLVVRFDPQDLVRRRRRSTRWTAASWRRPNASQRPASTTSTRREPIPATGAFMCRRMREALDLERTLSIDEVAALLPDPPDDAAGSAARGAPRRERPPGGHARGRRGGNGGALLTRPRPDFRRRSRRPPLPEEKTTAAGEDPRPPERNSSR